jgi:hypothetical protein
VAQQDLAGHDRGIDAGRRLPQAGRTSREVVFEGRQVRTDGLRIEDDNVSVVALAQQTPLGEAVGLGRNRGQNLPDLYDALTPHALQALWSISLLYPEPRTPIRPWIWKWDVVRPWLLRAGELIDTTQAERRALLFANPGVPDRSATTQTLVSAC